MSSSLYYPPAAFCFEARFSGASGPVDSSFSEVSGLDSEWRYTELREGGENRFSHRLPEPRQVGTVVLKRGLMAAQSAVFQWCKATLESDLAAPIETRSVIISLLDQKSRPTMTWSLANAWPVKWSVSAFDAATSAVATETLELAYTTLERKQNNMLPQSGTFATGA